jgi:hypothetical protein
MLLVRVLTAELARARAAAASAGMRPADLDAEAVRRYGLVRAMIDRD